MSTQQVTQIQLRELLQDEEKLTAAQAELEVAQAKFQIASRRYAATRDWVVLNLGNPYERSFEWPADIDIENLNLGRFRFIHMRVGDAVKEILRESEYPLDLTQIGVKLQRGHLRTAAPRSINAALMQLDGVEKTEDDKYRYVPEKDPSYLPF